MRILVANDDGVSDGLKALIEEGKRRSHSLFVATTSGQSSGMGKAISFRIRYRVENVLGVKGVIVESTPADAVAAVLDGMGRGFDVIISGVNHGPNLGLWDVLSSGTLGAVFEAVTRGVRGIAVSLVAREWREYSAMPYEKYLYAARLVYDLIERLPPSEWSSPVLNVNVPSWTVRGIKATFLETSAIESVYECSDKECDAGEWSMDLYNCKNYGSDVCAVKEGYISITPLSMFECSDVSWLSEFLEKNGKELL